MLNLCELEVFLYAAERCNFSAAARKLHMTQPAVSLQIGALERRLNASLFYRRGRAVFLTETGQALVPLARDLLAEARRVEEVITSLQGEIHGELAIACSNTSGKYLLPHLIARFRALHPKVAGSVFVTGQETALARLDAGAAQLAILSSEVEHRDFEYRRFFDDQIVLIVPRGHPWAGRGTIQPADLLSERFILREQSSGTRKVMQASLARHGIRIDDLEVCMELGNAEAIETSVEAGLGVAFVSTLAAAKGIALGQVSVVQVVGLELQRPIMLAQNRRYPATKPQAAFWDFVDAPEHDDLLHRGIFAREHVIAS
jgi:DNA-binding transcriptional LysR family regulator